MRLLPLLGALFLLSCAPVQPPLTLEERARQLAEAGQYLQAARAFETLALRHREPNRSIYTLYAARGYLLAGDLDRAERLFGRIDRRKLPPPHDVEAALLEIELLLARGEGERARRLWEALAPSRMTPSQRNRYLELGQRLPSPPSPPPPPRTLALLLPWSRLPEAARAIESGIEALRKRSKGAPRLLSVDTGHNPVSAYFKARNQGAAFILGPLLKGSVEEVARLAEGHPPVLALNVAVQHPPPNFYQFGLLPEQEVAALVRLAAERGGRRALILAPDTPFGRRVGRAFGKAWRRQGGQVVAAVYYLPLAADFTFYLQRLSESDLLFLAAEPEIARRVVPAARERKPVPIYALSLLYPGRPDPWRDAPLEGVFFCDLPWILKALPGYPSKAAFPELEGLELRLIPFGMDAYRLATEVIPKGGRFLEGATGRLEISRSGLIERTPLCARFREGVPSPLTGNR